MRIIKRFYNGGHDLITNVPEVRETFDKIQEICRLCPLAIFPHKSTSESSKGKELRALQQVINTHFKLHLKSEGFIAEAPGEADGRGKDYQIDFMKKTEYSRFIMEVDMGNGSSRFRDYWRCDIIDKDTENHLVIYIFPTKELGDIMDQGLINFTSADKDLLFGVERGKINKPSCLIGLDSVGVEEIDVRDMVNNNLKLAKGERPFREEHLTLVRELGKIPNSNILPEEEEFWSFY